MIKELVIGSTEKFHFFPTKGGISDHYIPDTLVNGRILNFNNHCKFEFGKYVQAHMYNDPRNNRCERMLDAINLRATNSDQGGHIMMDLTVREEKRGKLTTIL